MRTTTVNYNTEAAKSQKAPVWVVKLAGITTYFSTGTFSGITSSYKKCLKSVMYSGPQIDVQLALSDFGSLSFQIVDVDNVVTNVIKNNPKLLNTEVQLFHGYQSLAFTDFSQFPSYYIYEIKLSSDLLTYSFEARSALYKMFSGTLFANLAKTKISADTSGGSEAERFIASSDTTITVDDESTFNAVDSFEGIDDYIVIDGKEVCRYTAKTAVGAGADTFTVERNILSTTGLAQNFTTGNIVQQAIRVVPYVDIDDNCSGKYENPLWALLWLLTTTSAGTNGDFDQGVANCGLGIDENLIEVTNIQRLGIEHFCGFTNYANNFSNQFGFWWEPVTNPLEWIQEKFLKPIRAYFFISANGKLDLNILDAIPDQTVGTINDDNIIKISDISLRYDLVINTINYDEYNPLTNAPYGNDAVYTCTESVAAVGASEPFEIVDSFVCCHYTITSRSIRKIFGTHANPPLEFNVTVFDSANMYIPGDIINFTSDYFPDWINEGRGVSSVKCLVLEQEISNFTTSYKLLAFDALAPVDLYSVNKITSVTREAMSYEVDTTSSWAGMSANDAYEDNTEAYAADVLRLKFEITPPAAPDNLDRWTWIDIKVLAYTGTTNEYARDVRIHYNTSWTSVFNFWLYVYWDDTETYTRIRCDWYATDAPTVNDRPSSVKLKEVWFIEENYETAEA